MPKDQNGRDRVGDFFTKQPISRRDMIKRLSVLGLSASGAGSLLAACGAPSGTGSATNSAAPAGASGATSAAAPAATGATTLDFTTFYTGGEGHIMQALVDRYNQMNPDVNVAFSAPAWGGDYMTKLQTAALAGNPPPIVALHNYEIPPLAQFLYEMDPAALGINKDNFVDIAWQLPMYDGKLYGITMSTGVMELVYNKDHFEEVGLDPDKPPTNRDEFIAAAEKLTTNGRYAWARDSGGWLPFFTFLWQNGGQLLSEDGKTALLNTPEAIEAAQLEQDLVQRYKVAVPDPLPGGDLSTMLYGGQVSMLFMGPWNLNQIIKNNTENNTNLGWAHYPQFFDDKMAIQSTSHIYSLMKQNPEDPEIRQMGADFIKWVVTEGALTWAQAHAPANKEVLAQMETSDDPIVQGMTLWVDDAQYAHFPPSHPRWNEVSRVLQEGMSAITYEGADVKSTLDRVNEQANEILNRG